MGEVRILSSLRDDKEVRRAHRWFLANEVAGKHVASEIGHLLDYNEKELVEEFYAWMVALAEHIIPPITSDQEHFVEAAAGQTEPSTWFEEVFLKVRLLQIEVFEEARRELLNPSPEIVDTDEAIQKPVRTNEGYNRPCVCRGTNYDCIYCGGTGWRD